MTARRRGQDLLNRLADRGEQAIAGISELPGAERLLTTVNDVRERVDDLSRRVRGLDVLEDRVAELERRVEELERERRLPPPAV